MEHEEPVFWALLHAMRVPARCASDVQACGGPRQVLEAGVTRVPGLERHRIPVVDVDALTATLHRFQRNGGQIIGGADRAALGRLDRAPSPPLCAYAWGNTGLLRRRPAVAIVGTRVPTPEGALRAYAIAQALAARGILVVSGGARGIDIAAHQGALAGGDTVAVLGEAMTTGDDPRPTRLRALFDQNRDHALAVTAHGPSTALSRGHFVSRNRFIAALTDAVVVVEAGVHSGTFHTVEAASRLGVPVFVCDDDRDVPEARGLSRLKDSLIAKSLPPLQELADDVVARFTSQRVVPVSVTVTRAAGALMRRPERARRPPTAGRKRAVADTLGLFPSAVVVECGAHSPPPAMAAAQNARRHDVIAPPTDALWTLLSEAGGALDRDELARRANVPPNELAARLLTLELDGHVVRVGPTICVAGDVRATR